MRLGGPEELMEIMANSPLVLRYIATGLDDEAIRSRPSQGGWSTIEVVGHLVDVERRAIDRIDEIQREDNPVVQGVDESEMVAEAGYQEQLLEDVLATFEALRNERLAKLEAIDESVWQRQCTFAGFGPATLEEHTGHLCNHDVNHITQIVRQIG